MHLEPADSIIARIESAVLTHPGGALAFDGDGTLWTGDVGEDLFHALIALGDFREPARAQLAREAEEHGRAAGGTGKELAERLYADYMAGLFPEERMCEIMTWAFAGWTWNEVDAFAASVLAKIGLEARLHAEAGRVVRWAKEKGVETFLVSASPRAIIEHAARLYAIDGDHVVAALPRYEGDRMLPDVHRPIPYAAGKVKNLRDRLGETRPLYAAFGDNAFDIALLSEAFIPVAVRPKPRLRERASEVKKLVEIVAES